MVISTSIEDLPGERYLWFYRSIQDEPLADYPRPC